MRTAKRTNPNVNQSNMATPNDTVSYPYVSGAGRCANIHTIPNGVSKLWMKREEILLHNVAMSEKPAAIKRSSVRLLIRMKRPKSVFDLKWLGEG
jgi:hypothetical protein